MPLIIAAAWIYAGILSPFLLLCSYDIIERHSKLASPFLIFPSIGIASAGFYFAFQSVAFALYSHFLIAGLLFTVSYSLLLFQWKYTGPQSLALSILTVIACDELWQMPFNILNWTHSLLYAEIGLTTAGFDLMSVPLIGYFLLRFRKPVSLNQLTLSLLLGLIGLTSLETVRFMSIGFPTVTSTYPPYEPYYLIVPWFAFFLLLFRPESVRPIRAPSQDELSSTDGRLAESSQDPSPP